MKLVVTVGGACCASSPWPKPYYLCTLERGHDDDHEAWGWRALPLHTWPQSAGVDKRATLTEQDSTSNEKRE